jgi:hypothetical protein
VPLLRVFASEPAAFESRLPPDECLERLRTVSRRGSTPPRPDAITGRIGRSRVVLRPPQSASRVFGTAFPTMFVGRVIARDGGAALIGSFTISRLAKLSVALWSLFAAFWLVNGVLGTLARATSPERVLVVLVPAAALLSIVGADLIASSRRRRSDIECITRAVGAALARDRR